MSEKEKFDIAKSYVDQQLETMKQAGAAPKDMSEQEYKKIIEDVASTVQS